jgi:hypothetical protein
MQGGVCRWPVELEETDRGETEEVQPHDDDDGLAFALGWTPCSFARLSKINSNTRHLSRWRYHDQRPVTPWLWGTAEIAVG